VQEGAEAVVELAVDDGDASDEGVGPGGNVRWFAARRRRRRGGETWLSLVDVGAQLRGRGLAWGKGCAESP
jgi:hypothetical protein